MATSVSNIPWNYTKHRFAVYHLSRASLSTSREIRIGESKFAVNTQCSQFFLGAFKEVILVTGNYDQRWGGTVLYLKIFSTVYKQFDKEYCKTAYKWFDNFTYESTTAWITRRGILVFRKCYVVFHLNDGKTTNRLLLSALVNDQRNCKKIHNNNDEFVDVQNTIYKDNVISVSV